MFAFAHGAALQPVHVVSLVLGSCVLHAWWNLLIKRAENKMAFTALYLIIPPIMYCPLFVYFARAAYIPPLGWLCICGTGVVYFGYFLGLALAYRGGELSVAYPIARGLGPALAFLGAIVLLGERPTALGVCGVALILIAVWVLCGASPNSLPLFSGRGLGWGCPDGERGRWARVFTWLRPISDRRATTGPFPQDARATVAALFVALMMGCYSLIDKVAVGRLNIHPVVYIYCTYSLSMLLTVPAVVAREGVDAVKKEWRANWRACVAVGTLNLGAYLLVLFALASPAGKVSYVVPLRATSVLLGVLFGVGMLGEGRAAAKIGAALAMMAGIALITWKG